MAGQCWGLASKLMIVQYLADNKYPAVHTIVIPLMTLCSIFIALTQQLRKYYKHILNIKASS